MHLQDIFALHLQEVWCTQQDAHVALTSILLLDVFDNWRSSFDHNLEAAPFVNMLI